MMDEVGDVDMKKKFLPDSLGGANEAHYLIFDGSLEESETQIDDLVRWVATVIGIDIAALIPPEAGGPISGRALRLGQFQTQATVGTRSLNWVAGIKLFVSLATKLANSDQVELPEYPKGSVQALEPVDVQVTMGDGLPPDEFETSQNVAVQVGAGVLSPRTGIEELHPDWTQERVDQELARIAEGQRGAFGGPLDALDIDTENAEVDLEGLITPGSEADLG